MNRYFIKPIFLLALLFFLFACSANQNKNSNATTTQVKPLAITETSEPNKQQVYTATIPTTNTMEPNFIVSDSPDKKFKIELALAETPITLTVTDNSSNKTITIPLIYRHNYTIKEGFKWSVNNKLLLFVLDRDPNPEQAIESSSCFFVINIQKAELLKVSCSNANLHIQASDASDIVTLEHAGLNEPFDYYVPEINCYKNTAYGECVTSYISPSGNWELSPWEDSNVTLKNSNGTVWDYSYSVVDNQYDFILTTVQGWSKNENYVLFSPAGGGYETARVYGLFQMDLRNGNVISLLENKSLDHRFYYLSVSPSGTKVIYITLDGRSVIKDLNKNAESSFNIQLGNNEAIGNFVWSPDELMVVFSKLKYNENSDVVSLDYFRLNSSNDELITLLKNEPEYLNIIKMTNSEITIGQNAYSLVDETFLK